MSILYPNLPIVAEKDKIIALIKAHPVIIVAGETGCGKTTQLPKIALEAGLGTNGRIGHTQPRRIAARAVAGRIAAECESALGSFVGYKVRFSEKMLSQTIIKIMTDGILLSETQYDRSLRQYDCIIIDEAHERSLNIDFLLGYLKWLLTKRKDLKVIITSATIEVERFSHFFEQAPLVTVPGRTYPIEVKYLVEQSVIDAVRSAYQHGPGDILIFQSGEKEIQETIKELSQCGLPHTTLLPLYARLGVQAQQKIFQPSSYRKIIVATNVAETSITVPNIRFVIDTGFARISRYNYRNKLQRLEIEPISQASAEQRKGRCGRIGPGICYRLYSEEDFLRRDKFTTPEILRMNLAGIILKMLSLGIESMDHFPLLDPLDKRYIKDGWGLLERLGAIAQNQLTAIGQHLACFPIEPRLARMLVAAHQNGALKEMLIIVSALSIVDPREMNPENREKARQAHAKWNEPTSDFISILNLWDFVHEKRKDLSSQQFKALCRENMLSFLRVCEWFDVHKELQQITRELDFKESQLPAHESLVHRALLAGLIDSIGLKSDQDKKEYIGARNIKFFVHPSSVLFKKMPRWIMTFDLIHTTKTYARVNAQVEASWIAEVGALFLKKHYGEPHFQSKTGYVVAFERATLFGLEVVSRKKVNYEKISLSEARAIFLREGLAEENAIISSSFYHKNKATLDRLREDEHKIGREDYLIDREGIYQFYDERLPASIASVKALVDFLKEKEDHFLCFTKENASLATKEELQKIERDFPSFLRIEAADFPLRYEQERVTLTVPIEALSKLTAINFHWDCPAHLILYFSIVEEEKEIAKGRDLNALYEQLKYRLVNNFIGEKKNITAWDFGDLPNQCQMNKLIYYLALVDHQESVAIQLLETPKQADYYHRFGLARLYLLRLAKPIADIKRKLSSAQKRKWIDFFSDCLMASALSIFLGQKKEIRTQSQFEAQLKYQAQFVLRVEKLVTLVEEIVSLYQRIQTGLKQQPVADISMQLQFLFAKGFIKQTPYDWLKRYPIYLKAILIRLEKRSRQLAQDKQMQSEIESVQKIYLKKCAINKLTPYDEEEPLALFRWKVEELRVSYFAQILGTTEPVSKVRLLKLLELM